METVGVIATVVASLAALAGLVWGAFRWRKDRAERRQQQQQGLEEHREDRRRVRRREILEALIEYDRLLRRPTGGDLPTTPEKWGEKTHEIRALQDRVLQVMDLDRATAGRRWCADVEACLGHGLQWANHWRWQQDLTRARGANTWLIQELEHREFYTTAYRRIIESEHGGGEEVTSDGNPRVTHRGAIGGGVRWFLERLNKYHGATTALATVVLALMTTAYLVEVRRQREFAYQQMVLQNMPSIEIGNLQPFEFGATMRMSFGIRNKGGPAQDVVYGFVIVCCTAPEEIEAQASDLKYVAASAGPIPRLGRDSDRSRYLGFTPEQREWLEPAAKRESIQIYGYMRAYYRQPSLEEPGSWEVVTQSQSFWWNGVFKKWMEISPVGHERIKAVVEARGTFDQVDEAMDVE